MRKLIAVLVSAVGFSAFADEVRWTGAVDQMWETGGNWEGGSMPGKNDTAVFSGENGTTNTVHFKYDGNLFGPSIGSIRVAGGDWHIGAPARSASSQRDVSFFLLGDGAGGPAIVDVASEAKLVCSNKVVPASHDAATFRKTGGGTFRYGALGENNFRRWANIVFLGGDHSSYWAGSWLATTNLYVGAGVTLTLDNGSNPRIVKGRPSVRVESGATVQFYTEEFDGISGSGAICSDGNNGVLYLYLTRGPYRFDGKIGGRNNLGVQFEAQGDTTDEAYQFVVGSANVFSSPTPVKFTAGGAHPLKFAPGVGTFYFHMLSGKQDAPLELVDLDGEPVTLVVDSHAQAAGNFPGFADLRFFGPGSFVTRHRIDDGGACFDYWGQTYTNDVFKGLTGTLGIETAMGDLYIGDNNAAHDADLSTVSAVKVMTSGAKFLSKNVEKNVHDWQLDVVSGGTATFNNRVTLKGPVTGSGTVTLSGADSVVEDLRGSSSSATMFATASKDVTLASKDAAVVEGVKATVSDMTMTFSNGVFRNVYVANGDTTKTFNIWEPKGINLYGASEISRKFVIGDGATVWLAGTGYGNRHPSYIEVLGGGTLVQRVNEAFGTKVTGHTLRFDGGTYVCCPAGLSNGTGILPTNMEDWLFQVGAGGGTIDYDFRNKFSLYEGRGKLTIRAAYEPDPTTGTSGAFHFRTPGQIWLSNPVTLAGEVFLDEGMIRFTDNAANQTAMANGTLFGTGDIHLGQAMLDFGIYSADLTPKLGAQPGQRFYYDAGSIVIGRRENKAAQTVTFGNGSGAPFYRGGRGASADGPREEVGVRRLGREVLRGERLHGRAGSGDGTCRPAGLRLQLPFRGV